MRYRALGATGLTVSEIGFGAWGVGGVAKGAVGYGPTDSAESLRALRRAFDLGVNFFDTSNLYGYGHSESLIGQALSGVRSQVVIASKVGMVDATDTQDFSQSYLRLCLEESLERLGTDYIDLYQLHSPPIEILRTNPEIWDLMESFKREGKVKEIGISLASPADGIEAVERTGAVCIQANFNMVDQRVVDNGLLTFCRERNVGFIGRTPLSFGFLTGEYSENQDFHTQDHRRNWATEQLKTWSNSYGMFASKLVNADNQTQAQAALRYCLSYSEVSAVIPGMLTCDHVEENAAASDLGGLTDPERTGFEDVYRDNIFFAGPR